MKRKIIAIIIICFVIISCKKEGKLKTNQIKPNENLKTVIKTKPDSLTVLFTINNNDNEEIRISAYQPMDDNKYFLVADKNFIIVSKYLKIGKKLQFIKKDTLISNEFTYSTIGKESFQKTKIKDQEYILLSVNEVFKGNAVTEQTVSFIIIDIKTLKFYTLMYVGEPSLRSNEAIDGKFVDNKILDSKPEIKKALYEFANKSKWVFHTSKDQNHYTNYVEKWETDNNAFNHLANGYSGIPDVIYSTYYEDDLFKYTGNYTQEESIENNNFKIVSYFRGNIIAFDKNKKLYFPIYTETCVTGCNKKIRFVSENSIEVRYEESSENETFIIKLNEIIFKN